MVMKEDTRSDYEALNLDEDEARVDQFAVVADVKQGSRPRTVTTTLKSDRKRRIWWTPFLAILSASLAFVLVSYVILDHLIVSNREEVCVSEVCVKVASGMLEKMNRSVDPCEDFYEFACGGWMARAEPPEGVPDWHPIFQRGFQVFRDLKKTLETRLERPIGYSAKDKAAVLFGSCTNQDEIRKRGFQPLQELVAEIGGWDMMIRGGKEGAISDIEETLRLLVAKSVHPLFWLGTSVDKKNTSRYVISIEQPTLSFPYRNVYVNESSGELYSVQESMAQLFLLKLMNSTLEAMGVKWTEEHWTRAEQMLEFEARIAQIMDSDQDRSDSALLYTLHSIRSLQEEADFMNWKRFLGGVYEENLSPDQPVVVFGIGYLRKLTLLLKSYSARRRIVEDYMRWKAVLHYLAFVDLDLLPPHLSYGAKAMFRGNVPTWIYCMSRVTLPVLSDALTEIYMENNVDSLKIKESVEGLTANIMRTLREEMEGLSWMDKTTKKTALKKVDNIIALVGFSERIDDTETVDKDYSELSISTDFFWNIVNGFEFHKRKSNQLLHTTPSRKEWTEEADPVRANAYYSFSENRILIPISLLAPQLFFLGGPDFVNYGAIGSVIGHELTHGFDENGRKYGEQGNIRDWWSSEAEAEYFRQSECLVNQYSDMSHDLPDGSRITSNGQMTYSENLADNGGLKLAYLAYQNLKGKSSAQLPGLGLDKEQSFFLSFAQTWCAVSPLPELRFEGEVHAEERFRVLGPLRNMKEFSAAYSCPVGSRMNPPKKCPSLW